METPSNTIEMENMVAPEFTLAETATSTVVERPGQLSFYDPDEGLDQTALDI